MSECTCPEDVVRRFNEACAEIRARVNDRQAMCRAIARHAERFGLDASVETIDRHYDWFKRWYHGEIAMGYLMRRTGVRRKPRTRL